MNIKEIATSGTYRLKGNKAPVALSHALDYGGGKSPHCIPNDSFLKKLSDTLLSPHVLSSICRLRCRAPASQPRFSCAFLKTEVRNKRTTEIPNGQERL